MAKRGRQTSKQVGMSEEKLAEVRLAIIACKNGNLSSLKLVEEYRRIFGPEKLAREMEVSSDTYKQWQRAAHPGRYR